MAKLSGEMIHNGLQLEVEAYRLAAVELGVDFDRLASLARSKRDEALSNLSAIFKKASATLNDVD